jgi:hypothetical protein
MMDDLVYRNKKTHQEPLVEKTGWDMFSEEVCWFLVDFFKYELNGYEQLMFYSYFINGLTLEEIAGCADCSFQWIGTVIKKIEKRLHWAWKHQKEWRAKFDDSK